MFGAPNVALAVPLTEVCRSALAQDPELAMASQATREFDERLTAARTGFFPRLQLNGELASNHYTRASGYVPLFTRAAEVAATEMIYDGGATWHRAAATERERDALRADRAATANRVALNVTNAHLNVARNRELLASAERYFAEHTRAAAQVEAMARADRGKGFDVKQVRARAVLAQSQVAERKAELLASEGRFQELTGAPAPALDVPVPLAGPGFDSLASALALGDSAHPSLVGARHRQEGRLAARYEAEAAFVPLFNAEARYRIGADRNSLPGRNDEGYLGVRASLGLSSGGGQANAVRAARAETDRAGARVEALRRDVREAVRVAWDRRAGAIATLPLAETSYTASLTVLAGFRSQYQAGQRSVLDLLRVQADAYGAETRVITMRYDRLRADFELAHSQGRLLDQLAATATAPAPVFPQTTQTTQVTR